jgi:hypothetical protein
MQCKQIKSELQITGLHLSLKEETSIKTHTWAVKPHPAEPAGPSNFQMALRWISTVNFTQTMFTSVPPSASYHKIPFMTGTKAS